MTPQYPRASPATNVRNTAPLLVFALSSLLLAAFFFILGHASPAQAAPTVSQPNGTVNESAEDLRVKVLGGWITIARTWSVENVATGGGKWYFNPAWADLQFTYDSLDGSVRSIRRINSAYDKGGNGIFLFDKQDFIKALTIPDPMNAAKTIVTGWRWYNTSGNWITYNKDGRITAYGDRNNIQVTFDLDSQSRPTAIKDHFGSVVLSFTYTGDKLTRITDRANRQVQYGWSGNDLTQVTDVLGNITRYEYTPATVVGGGGVTGSIGNASGGAPNATTKGGRVEPATTLTHIIVGSGGSIPAPLVDISGQTLAKNLAAIIDPEGRRTSFTYTGGNRVTKMTDPENHETTYETAYDKGRRQWTVTSRYATGRRTDVVYNALGQATRSDMGTRTLSTMVKESENVEVVTDERGYRTRNEYDSKRNLLKVTNPDGSSISTTYDPVYSKPRTRTDEAGIKTAWEYDSKGNVTKMVEAQGLVEERTTNYTTDQYGQRLTVTRKGSAASNGNAATPDATTTFTWDNYGNLNSITDPEGNKTEHTVIDVMGNVTSLKDPRGNTSTLTFNAKGWNTAMANALGHTTRLEYDKVGNRTKVTDPKNAISSYIYNKRNEMIQVTDPLGGLTNYEYDKEGRKTKETDPGHITPEGQVRVVTRYEFDTDGRLSKMTDGNGNVTQNNYGGNGDGLEGLLKSVTYPTYIEEYKYDNRNRITQTVQILDTNPTANSVRYTTTKEYDGRGNVISQTDAQNRKTKMDYDALNRLIKTTDALNGVTQQAYDVRNNIVSVTDANGSVTRYEFDKANRNIKETRPLGEATTYQYDVGSNLTMRTNGKGEQRQYTYDGANRRTKEEHLASGSNVASRTIVFSLDERSQLSGFVDSGSSGSNATNSGSFVYDLKRQKFSETVTVQVGGTVGSPVNAIKTTTTAYHPNGLKATTVYPAQAGSGSVGTAAYFYDTNNQLKSITLPSGQIINYSAYRWTAPTQKVIPGAVVTMNYDALLRPMTIKSQAINKLVATGATVGQIASAGTATNPLGIVIQDIRLNYNEVSNIIKRETEHGTYNYAYDDLDRLTQVIPPNNPVSANAIGNQFLPIEGYSYDGVHNRKSSLHQTGSLTNAWTYNAHHQLTQWGDTSGVNANQPKIVQSFDANGHLKSKTVAPETYSDPGKRSLTYSYDIAERLTRVQDGSQNDVASYAYDPFGRRIKKSANQGAQAGMTLFFYSDEGLLAETDQLGNITTTYGWMPNGTWGTAPVFKRDHVGATTTEHYYHSDHLGTAQRLTNAAGEITWRAYSEAFGKTIVDETFDFVQASTVINNATTSGQSQMLSALTQTAPPITTGVTANNLRFPGQYFDQETGTHYNYFRDYDPATGRYIQSDPIGLKGGINTFAYAYDSPLRYFDPKGLDAFGFEQPNPGKATTVCRYGYPVIQIPLLKGIQDKCWGDCAYLHELVHWEDYTRWGFGSRCRGKPDGAIITVDIRLGRDSEIRAYEVEIQCLQAKLNGLTKCNQCYSPVETRLNDVTSTRDRLGYRR